VQREHHESKLDFYGHEEQMTVLEDRRSLNDLLLTSNNKPVECEAAPLTALLSLCEYCYIAIQIRCSTASGTHPRISQEQRQGAVTQLCNEVFDAHDVHAATEKSVRTGSSQVLLLLLCCCSSTRWVQRPVLSHREIVYNIISLIPKLDRKPHGTVMHVTAQFVHTFTVCGPGAQQPQAATCHRCQRSLRCKIGENQQLRHTANLTHQTVCT
jgi:hypothetical protein